MFLLLFGGFNLTYLGVVTPISLLLITLGVSLMGYVGFNCLNFIFIFLGVWLIYLIFKRRGEAQNRVYFLFLLIFFLYFSVEKMLFFFIFFEVSLVPTYFLVIRGGTPERTLAGKYLILYTFFGRVPLFFRIIVLGGLRSFKFYFFIISINLGYYYFFILAFLIKLPIFLFHLWLPKAHVEASTEGSMVLAGVLLKLGRYGLLLFLPYLEVNLFLGVLAGWGGVYAGIFRICQSDIKGFIAYSSITHMSLIFLKSFRISGLKRVGGAMMRAGHGFISAGMFFTLSLVYNFTGSRNIFFIRGLLSNRYFTLFFCGLCLIFNASAPFSLKFFGEVFLFFGLAGLTSF